VSGGTVVGEAMQACVMRATYIRQRVSGSSLFESQQTQFTASRLSTRALHQFAPATKTCAIYSNPRLVSSLVDE